MRAQVYALLARLLAAAPDGDFLSALGAMRGNDSPFGAAIERLAAAARAADPAAVADEFAVLFVGVAGSERTPYASYYLTGFLNEKPLAELRDDMARFGIARADGVTESEDHIASLFEMMSGLITGAFAEDDGDGEDGPLDIAGQKAFYDRHIGSWAGRFFADLETSPSAGFYRAVAGVGQCFLAVEAQAFDLAA
ncbi:molecular chaperone TorD [Azospirillum thermophilum]|uniref:Molecular chaperone TorD n=2 Tax=Azospirillum thermophilum TaxID=2202148 RepID=A0A2S2CTY0_9PROT|nr:molecular chaperone TorD [Azospirillum thermophilum]